MHDEKLIIIQYHPQVIKENDVEIEDKIKPQHTCFQTFLRGSSNSAVG